MFAISMITAEFKNSHKILLKTTDSKTNIPKAMIDIGKKIGCAGIRKAKTMAPIPEPMVIKGMAPIKTL